MVNRESQCHSGDEQEEFGELLKYTGAGFAAHDRRGTRLFWIPPKCTRSMARSHARQRGKACLMASVPSGNAFEVHPGQWLRRTAGESCLQCYFRGSSIGASVWSESMFKEWKDFISRFLRIERSAWKYRRHHLPSKKGGAWPALNGRRDDCGESLLGAAACWLVDA